MTAEPFDALPEPAIQLSVWRDGSELRWELERAHLVEALSELYAYELDVVTEDAFPDLRGLLGARVTVRLARADAEARNFHGIIRRIREGETRDDERWALRLDVVPELWLLSKRRDSRIFPHRDLRRIVREVLDGAGLYRGDRLDLHLHEGDRGAHATREHCVQYQETDLDFLTRLLEEEGTGFFFRHERDQPYETFVVADAELGASSDVHPPLRTYGGRHEVRLVRRADITLIGDETIGSFSERLEIRSDGMTLHDHDFTRAGRRDAHVHEERATPTPTLPVYEHPGRYLPDALALDAGQPAAPAVLGLLSSLAEGFVANANGGLVGGEPIRLVGGAIEQTLRMLPHVPLPQHAHDTGDHLARVRLQEERWGANLFDAAGNVVAMTPGSTFALANHPRNELEQRYVVSRAVHDIRSAIAVRSVEGSRDEPDAPRYQNRVECFPDRVVHRPARRTPRPRIHGTQTATVVGGPGEEIHVDAYGRVRVQLHWDRKNACHENLGGAATSSGDERSRDPALLAWARCAQAWAGAFWGSMFVPRVGMEVVVTFEDGDPDRPMVVGCVYNSANPPPYDLPSGYHRSTIRSRSIPSAMKLGGREGFNEIRFDDLANHEEIYVHAERDLSTLVRNRHETWVGGGHDTEVMLHQSNRVHGAQVEAIGGHQKQSVGGTQSVTVAQQRSVEVHGTDRHFSGGGLLAESSDFDTKLVRGIHLHYVAPATQASPETDSDVASVYRAISHVLDGRAAGRLVDPYMGRAEPAPADAAAGTSEQSREDADAEVTHRVPLESYVVNGDRLKRIGGLEDVAISQRTTVVSLDDTLDVLGRYAVGAGESASMVVHGADVATASGFTAQAGPPRVDVFLAGKGLRITEDLLRVRHADRRLLLDGDGVQLGSASGAVRVHLGDGTDYGLHLEDDGDTVRLASKQGSSAVVASDVTMDADGKLVLSAGSARITLDGGNVTIEGGTITLKGKVQTE